TSSSARPRPWNNKPHSSIDPALSNLFDLWQVLGKHRHNRWVKMATALLLYPGHGLFYRPGPLVRPFTSQSIKNIGHGHQAGLMRNVLATQTVWITTAIPLFMVAASDRCRQLQQTRRLVAQDFLANEGVATHD